MSDLSGVQAILFDTEGVLYHRPRQDRYLTAFLEQHDLKPRHPSILERALRAARFDVLTGRIPLETYLDAVLQTHGITDPALLKDGREALFQDAADIELYPGVPQTLPLLQEAGLRLGAVVDSPYTPGEEIAWMAARQLSPGLWTVFVVSADVGATKTEPLPFERALAPSGPDARRNRVCGPRLGRIRVRARPGDADHRVHARRSRRRNTLPHFLDLRVGGAVSAGVKARQVYCLVP